MTNHYWGDKDFDWESLNNAINDITKDLRKARIRVHSKEKYGTARFEFVSFWDGGLYNLLWPQCIWIKPGIRHFIYFILDEYVVKPIINFLKIKHLVIEYQSEEYKKAFIKAIKKYPRITEEIIFDVNEGVIKRDELRKIAEEK